MIKAPPRVAVEPLLDEAQKVGLTLTELSVHSRNPGMRPADLLNVLSIEVARRFVQGEISYAIGDETMNGLFAAIIDVSMDEEMPQPAFNIYLAFDEGEYQHVGDSDQLAPSERYTRPQLLDILQELACT